MASLGIVADPVYYLIRQAVLTKQVVVATYAGYERQLCPHVLGIKEGRYQCLFYQFGGDSNSGLEPQGSPANWRCLPLDQLEDVRLGEGAWRTALNHSRHQSCVGKIDVEVSY